jgi:hypothetical protein
MLVALSEKIWANGFYAPAAIDQYEETTASWFSTVIKKR